MNTAIRLLAVVTLVGIGWIAGRMSVASVEPEAVRPPTVRIGLDERNPSEELVDPPERRALRPADPATQTNSRETDLAQVPVVPEDREPLGEFEFKYAGTSAEERKLAAATVWRTMQEHTGAFFEDRLAAGDFVDVPLQNGQFSYEGLGIERGMFCRVLNSEPGEEKWAKLFQFPDEDYPLLEALGREHEWLQTH